MTTVCTVNILSYATGDSINDPYKLVAICVNLVISVTLLIFQWFTYKEGNVGEEEASFVSVLNQFWSIMYRTTGSINFDTLSTKSFLYRWMTLERNN